MLLHCTAWPAWASTSGLHRATSRNSPTFQGRASDKLENHQSQGAVFTAKLVSEACAQATMRFSTKFSLVGNCAVCRMLFNPPHALVRNLRRGILQIVASGNETQKGETPTCWQSFCNLDRLFATQGQEALPPIS